MPKKTTSESNDVPKFASTKPSGKKTPVAKLQLSKAPVDTLGEQLKELLKQVKEKGIEAEFGRGTITLY